MKTAASSFVLVKGAMAIGLAIPLSDLQGHAINI